MSLFDSTLAGVCSLVTDGTHDTPKSVVDGFPLVKAKEIAGGIINFDQCEKISETDHKKVVSRSKPEFGDTIFAHIGASLGEAAFVNSIREFSIKNVALFKPNPNIVDPRYLYYFVISHHFQERIKAMRTGSAQPFLGLSQLRGFSVRLHKNLSVQRRIASILSAYDDLIENNTRRIAILEEMARRIYEEWFVHFRFPGHEQVKMVESELGLIPEGWSVVSASDAIAINPKVRIPKVGLKPFVPMGSLSENSMLITDIEEREGNSGSKFQNGDTLFARITPCLENGKTGFVQFLSSTDAVAFGSTEFIVLRSRTLCPEYVYALARSDEFRANAIKSMSGATGRQRVKEACFDSFFLAQPCQKIMQHYREAVHPMFGMIKNLSSKNANLRATRDLLLPKLISGELDVSSLPEPEEVITA